MRTSTTRAPAANVVSSAPIVPPAEYVLEADARGRLTLPATPQLEDVAGHCAWLTAVFALDPAHPITAGRRFGFRGPAGRADLFRADASPISFEPIAQINAPTKLIEALSWAAIPSDGAVPGLKGEHCRMIAHVVRMLCGVQDVMTDEQETAAIVGTFLSAAVLAKEPVCSYGTSGQRYEAAVALRRDTDQVTGRPYGPPRYAYDADTGELLIAVGDLADAARKHVGSSLPRGWLEARMDALGWRRIDLQGFGLPGRAGRQGPHARIGAYRGILPFDDDTAVNT